MLDPKVSVLLLNEGVRLDGTIPLGMCCGLMLDYLRLKRLSSRGSQGNCFIDASPKSDNKV